VCHGATRGHRVGGSGQSAAALDSRAPTPDPRAVRLEKVFCRQVGLAAPPGLGGVRGGGGTERRPQPRKGKALIPLSRPVATGEPPPGRERETGRLRRADGRTAAGVAPARGSPEEKGTSPICF
jgi:hypothetical protein